MHWGVFHKLKSVGGRHCCHLKLLITLLSNLKLFFNSLSIAGHLQVSDLDPIILTDWSTTEVLYWKMTCRTSTVAQSGHGLYLWHSICVFHLPCLRTSKIQNIYELYIYCLDISIATLLCDLMIKLGKYILRGRGGLKGSGGMSSIVYKRFRWSYLCHSACLYSHSDEAIYYIYA